MNIIYDDDIDKSLLQVLQRESSNLDLIKKKEESFQKLFNDLNEIDFSYFGLNDSIHFEKFGSCVNGFESKNSDIDTTLLTNSYVDERHLLKIIYFHFNEKKSLILINFTFYI